MKTAAQEVNDLKLPQVGAAERIYESFGTGPDGVHRVARVLRISKDAAQAIATAITTKPAAPVARARPVTESAPDLAAAASTTDMAASRKTGLAAKLVDQVRAAEAKPINECSIQELEALAAAAGGEAGMFGGG